MFRVLVGVLGGALGALVLALPAAAQVKPFPGDFRTQDVTTDDGATLHIRSGGQGPAVVLLHGFGDTGDMWAPLAAELARDHTVVVPDLRGMGLSSHPTDGYDKRTQAADIRAILTHLRIDREATPLRRRTGDAGDVVQRWSGNGPVTSNSNTRGETWTLAS